MWQDPDGGGPYVKGSGFLIAAEVPAPVLVSACGTVTTLLFLLYSPLPELIMNYKIINTIILKFKYRF